MGRVTGFGGLFFKAADPAALAAWYRTHLGLPSNAGGNLAVFPWRDSDDPAQEGYTVWSPFPRDTRYFDPSTGSFMVNFRVEDLDALLAGLRSAGADVDDRVQESEYGRFGWVMDPEGNRIELWEPPRA
jgi:predicted enzyme related to lactoylglutathione lyase